MQHVQTFPGVQQSWTPATSDRRRVTGSERRRRWPHGVASMAAASGLSLLFPLAILAVGAPLALAVRGIAELGAWLLSMF
jgi:hypothetical protein